jgi:hypothetical protein
VPLNYSNLTNVHTGTSPFEKARTGLFLSLQKHLTALYAAEKAFLQSVVFADSFPFLASSVDAELLSEHWTHRNALRDLYANETAQLDTLTKAIRSKNYSEDEKKQLFLLLLGYMDIAGDVFELLISHVQVRPPKDEELEEVQDRFERVKKFARFNIKGLPTGLLTVGNLKTTS